MFFLGFWEDNWALGAKGKLIGQIAIASGVYLSGIRIETLSAPIGGGAYALGAWGYFATVFWLVALTNLINLIDGVDGLAGGIALMVMVLLLVVGFQGRADFPVLCTAAVCGAIMGFLCYNFPPATIQLGDGGVYFLGFLTGMLALVYSEKGTVPAALISPLIVLALPIVDMSLAILRRGLKGLPVFRPDRHHLHHRLARCGFSRTHVVLLAYGFSLVFLGLALAFFWLNGRWLPVVVGMACLILLITALSFSFSREWFSIGKVLGNSHAIRRQTRHALAMQRWLELEVERINAPERLWKDFSFLCRKQGFSEVILFSPDQRQLWSHPELTSVVPASYRARFNLASGQTLELAAPARIGPEAFELLSDLAAETWIKVTDRWQKLHRTGFELSAFHGEAPLGAGKVAVAQVRVVASYTGATPICENPRVTSRESAAATRN